MYELEGDYLLCIANKVWGRYCQYLNKKAVLSQGNRSMPPLFFSV